MSDWQVTETFTDAESGFSVQVQRDHSVKWPKFSIAIGRMRDTDTGQVLTRHIPIKSTRYSVGDVGLEFSLERLCDLIMAAQDFITGRLIENERERIEYLAKRENDNSERQKKTSQKIMRKGKTARDRAKRQGVKQ